MQLYASKVMNKNSNNNLVQSEQRTVQPTDGLWSRGELLEFLDYFQVQDSKLSGSPAQKTYAKTKWTRLSLTIITFLGISFFTLCRVGISCAVCLFCACVYTRTESCITRSWLSVRRLSQRWMESWTSLLSCLVVDLCWSKDLKCSTAP